MIKFRFLAGIGADAFELVTAILIIVVTIVALFFLYRNLSHEISEHRKHKHAIRDKDDEFEGTDDDGIFTNKLTVSKDDKVMVAINKSIKNTKEGDLGVMYLINLDDFRYVNEKYPQKTVDKLLKELEKKLNKLGGKDVIAGHLDEDVFIYYYQGSVDADRMNEIGNELLDLIREPHKIVEETITASIGLVVFPYDGISAEQLHKNAEIAVYVSKKGGKNRFSMYSEDLVETEQFNANYYQEIKKSISNDEFLLYYQTIVDVKTGRIIGLESLLRWNHPTMGILSPGRFLNVMELTGDITWFGTWGFEKIVSQYKNWNSKMRIRDLYISTNLSQKQLEVEGLAQQFHNITKKYGLTAETFCLEIIDFFALQRSPVALSNLAAFRKFGFRVAIDDVGENYQVLDWMPNLSAGIFKLTRTNVLMLMDDNEEANSLIKVIRKAKEQSKIVIAEGIEDENMISRMANLGIRFMQGYYFNHPKSVGEIEPLIANSPWDMTSFGHLINQEELR